MSTCRSCKADIIWAITKNENRIPVNKEPVLDGNVELNFISGVPHAIVHNQPTLSGEERYVSHFTTCPQAVEYRK